MRAPGVPPQLPAPPGSHEERIGLPGAADAGIFVFPHLSVGELPDISSSSGTYPALRPGNKKTSQAGWILCSHCRSASIRWLADGQCQIGCLNQARRACCNSSQQEPRGDEPVIQLRWVALSAVLTLAACGEQEQAQTTPEPKATTTQQNQTPATNQTPPKASGGYMEVGPGAGSGQGASENPATGN